MRQQVSVCTSTARLRDTSNPDLNASRPAANDFLSSNNRYTSLPKQLPTYIVVHILLRENHKESRMARNAQKLLDMAADILWTNATQRSTGLKNLLYAAPIPPGQQTMLIALVNGAHKERDQLFACAEEEGYLAALPEHLQPTSYTDDMISFQIQVVLYECLLGSRRVRGTSPLVEFTKSRKKTLQMTLAQRRKRGATHCYVPPVRMPRFVRVNHLKLSMAQAISYMESFGYHQVDPPSDSNNFTTLIKPMTFFVDPYIPSLLVLPPNTSLHGDAQTKQGGLILQDRSSCLTALALDPPPDAHCLDTCSSPGNKTLHLASIMNGAAAAIHGSTTTKGSITALERSPNRFQTLWRRVQEHGASHMIAPVERDFMTVDTATEYPNVTHVLIDPSCSGSGLVATYSPGGQQAALSEMEEYDNNNAVVDTNTVNNKQQEPDLVALAREQTALILHAMTLPNAQAIAYSTCSIHQAENEDVVLAVLKANTDWKLVRAIPQWPHRGLDFPEFAGIRDLVCRASLEQDGTNGFFVARFERVADRSRDTHDKNEIKTRKRQSRDTSQDGDNDEKEPTNDDNDEAIYKQVKKATKKILKKSDGRTMKYKALQKALREKLKLDKKKLREIMDRVVAKESKRFLLKGKHIRDLTKTS